MLELKINAGTPTHAWWKVKVDMSLLPFGLPEDDVVRKRKLWMGLANRLTSFLYEYLRLLEIPDQLFRCCANPAIISTDGNQNLLINRDCIIRYVQTNFRSKLQASLAG